MVSLSLPKKQTKKFDFTIMVPQVKLFSFIFLGEFTTPKRHLEINWPLAWWELMLTEWEKLSWWWTFASKSWQEFLIRVQRVCWDFEFRGLILLFCLLSCLLWTLKFRGGHTPLMSLVKSRFFKNLEHYWSNLPQNSNFGRELVQKSGVQIPVGEFSCSFFFSFLYSP